MCIYHFYGDNIFVINDYFCDSFRPYSASMKLGDRMIGEGVGRLVLNKILLFFKLYFINCKVPFGGKIKTTFFLPCKGGSLIAGKKVNFFPGL